MGIDQLHDGHGAEQEEQDLGDLAEVVTQFSGTSVEFFGCAGENLVGPEHQDGPAHHRGENRRSSLVDLDGVFQRDTQISDHEHCGHQEVG
jgi:hypothetical protein